MSSEKQMIDTEEEERGGIPIALLGWLLGVPGLIVLLLLFI